MLARGAACDIDDADVLVAWHDCLLYLIAYPESAALLAPRVRSFAVSPLSRDEWPRPDRARARRRLEGSGVAIRRRRSPSAGTSRAGSSRAFRATPTSIRSATTALPLPEALAEALPAMEFELLASDDGDMALLDEARGRARASRGSSRSSSACPPRRAAGAGVRCAARRISLARRRLRAVAHVRARTAGADVLPSRRARARHRPARARRRSRCLPRAPLDCRDDASRSSMSAARCWRRSGARPTRSRSPTPTASLARPRPRHRRRALHDAPGRRGPLDSHVGMMLFKNGVPVGYGGGWPFSGTLPDRRQHLRAVSRRRVGAPVRAGAARLSAMLRRRSLRRRAVAVRRHQHRKACAPARSGSTTGSDFDPSSPRRGARARRVGAHAGRSRLSHADPARSASSPTPTSSSGWRSRHRDRNRAI